MVKETLLNQQQIIDRIKLNLRFFYPTAKFKKCKTGALCNKLKLLLFFYIIFVLLNELLKIPKRKILIDKRIIMTYTIIRTGVIIRNFDRQSPL